MSSLTEEVKKIIDQAKELEYSHYNTMTPTIKESRLVFLVEELARKKYAEGYREGVKDVISHKEKNYVCTKS